MSNQRIKLKKYKLFTQKQFKKLIIVLSAFVVFLTTYALVLPAVAVEKRLAEEDPGIVLEDDNQLLSYKDSEDTFVTENSDDETNSENDSVDASVLTNSDSEQETDNDVKETNGDTVVDENKVTEEKTQDSAVQEQKTDILLAASEDETLTDEEGSSEKTYGLQISKSVIDESGNKISFNGDINSAFRIYRNGDLDADSVKDLNVGSFDADPDYTGYSYQHDKVIPVTKDGTVSEDTYDYDVTPGMYYIEEVKSSIPATITDTSGKLWYYKETYFLTEYAWRNHPNDNYMHVSKTYNSDDASLNAVPEILGDHLSYDGTETFTNDYLEFYVYNVYQSAKVDVPATKTWEDFDNDSRYDWEAVFKLQWAPIYEGEESTSGTFQDVRPIQSITIKKGDSGNAHVFEDLPLYGTDSNGVTFRYQYSLEEISYAVKDAASGAVIYSWDEISGYNTDDEDTHYQPFYPHDAGELSEDVSDYYIRVKNATKNIRSKEYIDVSLDKQWDESFGQQNDSFYAEFELKRYVHTEYRDVSHISEADKGADPIKVTIKMGDEVIHELSVLPNLGLYIGGNFAPHNGDKTLTLSAVPSISVSDGQQTSELSITAHGNNASNAIVRSQEFFVTQDTVITIISGNENLVQGPERAKVFDTSSGISPLPDKSFSQTIRLDNSNNWHVDLADLIRSETHSGDDDSNENVQLYEYYFVETVSEPEGYAKYYRANSDGTISDVPSGDNDHRITSDDRVIAKNITPNRLTVKKKWRGVPDVTGFPHVTFTLYQTWADGGYVSTNDGWVYENETTHQRYEHIEIPSSSLEWVCPEVLPETKMDGNRSREVGYYVVEDVRSGSDASGNVTTAWQFYYYINSDGKQTNAGHQGYFAGLTGSSLADKGGSITICNKLNNYLQLDIQKQFFMLKDAGSWDNVTATSEIQKNAVMGFKVLRAVKTPNGKYINDKGELSDTRVWMDYGEEMLCGYDSNGQQITQNDNENGFWLHPAGGNWAFRIEDNQGDATDVKAGGSGLPQYGYYILNGEDIVVEYEYTYRETNIYKDMDRTPYPEWDWFSSILPGKYNKIFEGQDSMRVANFQASDIEIHKQWIGDIGAQEVYIKLWRSSADGVEDFTKVIAEDVKNNQNWQMYVNDPSLIDTKNNWLVLRADEGGQWTTTMKVNRALLGTLAQTGYYHYYIQEVAYKAADGTIRTNPDGRFKPMYDKWLDGRWLDAPVDYKSYAGNNITIKEKGENKLKVINTSTPSTSYKIIKKFAGQQHSTGGHSSINGRYPTDGSKQIVVELQQRYRYEKTEDGIDYVSADNENWVRADSEEAKTTWTVDWQGAESAVPVSVALPLDKPEGSTLSDAAWYASEAAWTYTWDGLDLKKTIAEDADPTKSKYAQLYYRAVETSTPGWVNDHISAEEQDGHKAIDDKDQTSVEIDAEQNTVTNEQGLIDLHLNKQWLGLGTGETWPQGYTVDYQLVQEYHLISADVTNTVVGEDGLERIDPKYPEYPYGEIIKTVDMVRNYSGGDSADNVHPQAVRTVDNPSLIIISQLPMYGFFEASAADVDTAAEKGIVLTAGKVYPVVYTYAVKETSVKKNGVEIDGFQEQYIQAWKSKYQDKDIYKAVLTNELNRITVSKEWNGLEPGEQESATIGLYRFEKEVIPATFPYAVTVVGNEDVLSSDGSVSVTVYDENDSSVGSCNLNKDGWSHTFNLENGKTYHAVFTGDGTILNTEITPSSEGSIAAEKTSELTATVKPIASGSVKVVVTGTPNNLWMNPLAQYINGQRQESTAQNWDKGFYGQGGETKVLTGLLPGEEYRFQIGAIPSSINNASLNGDFVVFTASNGLTEITMNYEGGDDTNTTSGSFSGANSYWGVDDWSKLVVGRSYSFTFQVESDPLAYVVTATGTSSLSYSVIGNWGSSGQIIVNFVPASVDERVVIVASNNSTNSVMNIRRSIKAAPLRSPASINWINNINGLPDGADPSKDDLYGELVVLSGDTWSHTWEDLPKYSEDGKEYIYYAYETDYSGADGATSLETTYSKDANGNWIVTNTPTYPQSGNLKVTKQVLYGEEVNPDANDRTFTVGVFTDATGKTKVDGQSDKTIRVSNGTGEATFTDLPAGTYYVFEIVNGSPLVENGTAVKIDKFDYTVTYSSTEGTVVSSGSTSEFTVSNTQKKYDLNIIKVDEEDNEKGLDGAEFTLFKLKENESGSISHDGDGISKTTANGGKASFEELSLGYYEIKETKTPAGYIIIGSDTFYIQVSGSGVQCVERSEDQWVPVTGKKDGVTFNVEEITATVENTPGKELPHTGGNGIQIYMITGLLIMGFSLLLLNRKKRHSI